jgi:hypothetical protein
MTFETEKLVFRPYKSADKKNFVALFTDPDLVKYVGDGVVNKERAEAFWRKLFE